MVDPGSAAETSPDTFQRELSAWNSRFDEVATTDRSYCEPSDAISVFQGRPVHVRPTFVDTARVQEWVRVAASLRRLVLTEGVSLLPKDAQAIANLFGYAPEHASVVARLLARRERGDVYASRADFLLSAAGLKCCELDFGDIGLWNVVPFNMTFRHSPVVAKFVAQSGLRVRERDPLRVLVSELSRLVGRGSAVSECNLGVLVPDDTPPAAFEANHTEAMNVGALYQAALRTLGSKGEIVLQRASSLRAHGDHASIDGKRIHAVMTQTPTLPAECEMWTSTSLMDLVERRCVFPLNGPDYYAFSNKIVVALLSEAAELGQLDAVATQACSALPWTRRVTASTVRYQGREHELPELILKAKDDFVLKPGEGFASGGVCIGRNTSPSDWERALAVALELGTFVVQETVGGVPMWLTGQAGDLVPHGVNLGITMCGDEYLGSFLRLMPLAGPHEVPTIGYSQGALTGGLIEAENQP